MSSTGRTGTPGRTFRPGRCAAHMAVDENKVRFCAELAGQKSVLLPFDQGHDGGAGNPPNPQGLRSDYLWTETLNPAPVLPNAT